MKKALLIICMLFPLITFAQTTNGNSSAIQSNHPNITKDNADYMSFIQPIKDSISNLLAKYHSTPAKTLNNAKSAVSYDPELQTLRMRQKQLNKEWIKLHPDSYSSLIAIKHASDPYQDYKEAALLFNSLSDEVKNSTDGKRYAIQLEKFHTAALDTIAPQFNEPTPDGLPISPGTFKGKYLLIDFWASWCVPCRHENPAMVKIFKKYKAKNFTILGVSLDRPNGKDTWLAAIKKDGLTWTNVSDLQGWDSTAAKAYGIRAIPQNFLLDPNGKIIAKNLFGKALDDKLEEIFR